VLALLALVLFPVVAHAEESSNEAVYVPVVPKIEGSNKSSAEEKTSKPSTPHHKAEPNPRAKASGAEGNGGQESATGPESGAKGQSEGQKKPKEESSEGGKKSNPATTGGGGGGTPNSGGGGGGAGDGVGNGQKVPQPQSGANISHSSGGSSPVVPILIAVIVLAAISIGVVLYRQRKSGGQGPDRRVSSPNAS
jgi:cobalamin biosynthesis Mg chelatase CobN